MRGGEKRQQVLWSCLMKFSSTRCLRRCFDIKRDGQSKREIDRERDTGEERKGEILGSRNRVKNQAAIATSEPSGSKKCRSHFTREEIVCRALRT